MLSLNQEDKPNTKLSEIHVYFSLTSIVMLVILFEMQNRSICTIGLRLWTLLYSNQNFMCIKT